MGDRVAVMRKGELQQVADPQTLYDRPVNLFVGGFIGSPGDEHGRGDGRARTTAASPSTSASSGSTSTRRRSTARPALASYEGRPVILGIRPEDLEDASLAPDTPADKRLRGVVELREALGSELMVHFTVEGTPPALTEDVKELAQDAGDGDRAGGEGRARRSSSGVSGRGRVEEGKPLEVAVDTRSLHFFDAETSEGIYDETATEERRPREGIRKRISRVLTARASCRRSRSWPQAAAAEERTTSSSELDLGANTSV